MDAPWTVNGDGDLIGALEPFLAKRPPAALALLRRLFESKTTSLKRSELQATLREHASQPGNSALSTSPLGRVLAVGEDCTIAAPWIYLALRPSIAHWIYLRIHADRLDVERLSPTAFLIAKERAANDATEPYPWALELDFRPFAPPMPRLKESRSIGRGLDVLCRWLATQLFDATGPGDEQLLSFLRHIEYRGQPLLLSGAITNVDRLRRALIAADAVLAKQAPTAGWRTVATVLRELGFEAGWGSTVARVRETMTMLRDVLEAPDPDTLRRLLRRMPLLFSVAVISPHGYFGQANVLGRPDTGGQVVYILDQVRALEAEMRARIRDQGLEMEPQIIVVTRLIPESPGTTCSERIEAIIGTSNAHILRVPFRDRNGEVVPHWISRFEVWPYLEDFAREAETEICTELGGSPGLVIGNYSDGNLVAWLIAHRLGATYGSVAHALEKTKHPDSDLQWKKLDKQYHCACQYTADLLGMNGSDFIVASSYQEIAGTPTSPGQYESHMAFTMPGLYRVVGGTDPFDARFNLLQPGADASVFFPYTQSTRRFIDLHPEIEELIYGDDARPYARGVIEDRDKPLLFTITRLDRVKNIAGLVDWFGRSARLREHANLLIVAGHMDPGRSSDDDEREQIERMHDLIDSHQLDTQLRWIGLALEKSLAGELYRYVADTRGAFVQPALHEAFGLTVVEAMACGVPAFATCHGGPLEIIEHSVSGFHIDPLNGDAAAETMASFFEQCREDPEHWDAVSQAALTRIEDCYNWNRYANGLLSLAHVARLWRHLTAPQREKGRRYLEMLYTLQFRDLARLVPRQDSKRRGAIATAERQLAPLER